MRVQQGTGIPVRAYRRVGLAALSVLALTTIHHIYGAIAYHTPWRLHVAVAAPVAALAIVRALYLAGSQRGTRSGARWTRIAAVIIFVLPVGMIGLIEGGYNHLAKNLVYYGVSARAARALFPPPLYEMPDDLLFEASGIAQLPLALLAAWLTLSLLRRSARAASESP